MTRPGNDTQGPGGRQSSGKSPRLQATGADHGRRSVVAFSHEKAIFAKPGRPETLGLIRPPYTAARERIIRRLVR